MIQIIPAIDIIDGKCVRLEKGVYDRKKTYSDDPLFVARMFEEWGISRLHLVDLDGAKSGRLVNLHVLERISANTALEIDFGGGLRTKEDIQKAFEHGASMVTGGSMALKNPELFLSVLEKYGPEKIILGADHTNGKISVGAWMEGSQTGLMAFLGEFYNKGIRKVISTDIQKDGMLSGPSFSVYAGILARWPDLHLIASGGISCMDDIWELGKMGVPAVIVGKALYENRISEGEMKDFLNGKTEE